MRIRRVSARSTGWLGGMPLPRRESDRTGRDHRSDEIRAPLGRSHGPWSRRRAGAGPPAIISCVSCTLDRGSATERRSHMQHAGVSLMSDAWVGALHLDVLVVARKIRENVRQSERPYTIENVSKRDETQKGRANLCMSKRLPPSMRRRPRSGRVGPA